MNNYASWVIRITFFFCILVTTTAIYWIYEQTKLWDLLDRIMLEISCLTILGTLIYGLVKTWRLNNG